jgi:nucleotide-binding universal stress UspA family protein
VTSPIIAGTDGSEESLVAVEWAALEAARRRVPLAIVHALDQFPGAAVAHPELWWHDLPRRSGHDLPHRARSALARAMRYAAKAAPGIDLRAVAVCGRADEVLTAVAASAPLIVIGTRGGGGFPGLRLGSVALRLASRASCPVVFTGPDRHPAAGEIVVGAGDDDQALAALEFGFGEADLRGARLTAVHTWAHPRAGWPDNYDDWILSVGPLGEGAAPLLAGQVAPWRLKYPGVPVTQTEVHGQPWRVLTLASGRADLVVIGGHRGEGSPMPGLGSVSYAMLRHACCPVALIPDCRTGNRQVTRPAPDEGRRGDRPPECHLDERPRRLLG